MQVADDGELGAAEREKAGPKGQGVDRPCSKDGNAAGGSSGGAASGSKATPFAQACQTAEVIPLAVRSEIEAEIAGHFARVTGEVGRIYPEHLCMQWAFATAFTLQNWGFESCVNAGSARFLAVPGALDDGKSPTHLSYDWQGMSRDEIDARYLSLGILPEMHVWAAVPEFGLIVDMTTRFVPVVAAKHGVRWLAEKPPACLWACALSELPDGWSYNPSREASELAYELFEDSVKRRVGK